MLSTLLRLRRVSSPVKPFIHEFKLNSSAKKPILAALNIIQKIYKSNDSSNNIVICLSPFCHFFLYFSFSESALEHYIQRGKLLAKNPSESLRNLEDLIGNYADSEVYNKLLDIEEYRHHGPRNEFFIALVLPSLTGKTQMAFAIRSKRPLYFTFDSVQQNKCFKFISKKFLALLENDHDNAIECLQNKLKSFEKRYDRKEEADFLRNMLNSDFAIITLDTIEDYLRELKLKKVWFLLRLL